MQISKTLASSVLYAFHRCWPSIDRLHSKPALEDCWPRCSLPHTSNDTKTMEWNIERPLIARSIYLAGESNFSVLHRDFVWQVRTIWRSVEQGNSETKQCRDRDHGCFWARLNINSHYCDRLLSALNLNMKRHLRGSIHCTCSLTKEVIP